MLMAPFVPPLGWFDVVYAVCVCYHTTGCKTYSVMIDGYGIFNVHTNLGCVLYS